MNQTERSQAVTDIIQQVQNHEQREFYRAKTTFLRKLSEVLDNHGQDIDGSNLLKRTPRVSVEEDGISFDFWIEEYFKSSPEKASTKQTILNVLPSDEENPYVVFKVDCGEVSDINDIEIEEVAPMEKLTEVLSFLDKQLQNSKITSHD